MSMVNCHPFDKLKSPTLSASKGQWSIACPPKLSSTERRRVNCWRSQHGFTFIEILLVMAAFAILISFTSFSFLRSQKESRLDTTVQTLASDLKDQQTKAMSGGSDGSSHLAQGIFFETNRYILFSGNTYNASSPNNFAVDTKEGINIFTTFPSNQIVFSQNNGEVENFAAGSNTITVTTENTPTVFTPTCNDADVNDDGTVNITDIFLVIQNFGSSNPQYDVDRNGIVNITDLVIIQSFFGQTCPPQTISGAITKTITVNQLGTININ